MLPTPDISHLTSSDYDKVYEPAEDSFLFLDSIEKEASLIKSIRYLIYNYMCIHLIHLILCIYGMLDLQISVNSV